MGLLPPARVDGSRVFLANVGANAAHPARSPLFTDGTFELVPIPEPADLDGPGLVRYRDLRCFNAPDRPLAAYLPARYTGRAAHYDPEFETFTYGDNCWRAPRAAALRAARRGDWILFLARLVPYRDAAFIGPPGFYLVAALEIEEHVGPVRGPLPEPAAARFRANAHVRRAAADPRFYDGFCLFRGSARSVRFRRAIPFTRGLASLLADARGAPWAWPSGRSDLQVIGSHTRTVRPVRDPAAFWQAVWEKV